MTIRFETQVAAGSLLAAAVLATIAGFSLVAVHDAAMTAHEVSHTSKVLAELQSTLAALSDAESGVHGFLLTDEPAYLERQGKDFQRTRDSLHRLARATRKDPQTRARVAQLRAEVGEKLDFMRELQAARERLGPAATAGLVVTGRGRELMDRVTASAAALEESERALLVNREEAARDSARRNIRAVLLAAAGDILLLGLAVLMIRREIKARRELAERLQDEATRLNAIIQTQEQIAERELEPESAFAMVAERARRLTGASGSSLHFLEGEELVRRAATGVAANPSPQAGTELHRLTEACLARQELMASNHLEPAGGGECEICSVILAPLPGASGALGVLEVHSEKRDAFSRTDQQALALIAGFAATALGNAKAFATRQQLINQLTALNEELEAFSFSVSHDLRAPLRHIDGFVDLLRQHAGPTADAKTQHYLEVIASAAQQMSRLIDDLLAFARIGRAELHRVPVDLEELVRAVVAEMADDLEGRAIDWQIEPLPTVQADATLLRQVMTNLLANAAKYTRPRAPAVITTGATRENGEVVVYVRDNGVGFEPQSASRLFGVFERLHAAEEFEGVGIGLANVRRVIQKHGGRVWAEGVPGVGATFYFTLPDPTAPL